jgi:hypothetical protein
VDFQLGGGRGEATDLTEGDVAVGGRERRGEFADADVAVFDFRGFELKAEMTGGKRFHFIVREAKHTAADLAVDEVDGALGTVNDGLYAVPTFSFVVDGVAADIGMVLLRAEHRPAAELGEQAGVALAGGVVRIRMQPCETADLEENEVAGVTFLDLAFHRDRPDSVGAFVRIGDVIVQAGVAGLVLARLELFRPPGVFEVEVETREGAVGDDHAEVAALVFGRVGIHMDGSVAHDDVTLGVQPNICAFDGDAPTVEIAAVEERFPTVVTMQGGSGNEGEDDGGFHVYGEVMV